MRVAFFVSGFPALSITFIIDQVTGLLDRGVAVDIFAFAAVADPKLHPAIERHDLLHRTTYLHMPRNKLWRLMKAKLLLARHYRHLPVLLRTLDARRFGRDALTLRLFYAACAFLDRAPYDVLHCHFGPIGALGAGLVELGICRAPLVTTFHGHGIRLGLERGAGIYALLRRHAAQVHVISGFNRTHLERFGFDGARLVELPVGVRLDRFRDRWAGWSANERAVPPGEPVRILSVGTLLALKGHADGIRCMHRLRERRLARPCRYAILGGGPEEAALRALVAELGLEDVVELLGPGDRDDVARELERAQLFLLPSRAEATPVVLMEAQAAGLPVVATDVGGVAELVADGRSGYVVPPGDVEAMAARLARLLDDPASWPRLGRAGRRYVEEHHDIERLNDRLLALYEGLRRDPARGGPIRRGR